MLEIVIDREMCVVEFRSTAAIRSLALIYSTKHSSHVYIVKPSIYIFVVYRTAIKFDRRSDQRAW